MNFDLSEEQQVVRDLATQVFGDLATPERVKEVEAADGFDHDLWTALAEAGLLGLCLPESNGGSGMGLVELCLIAEQQGRNVAPVPLVSTVVSAMTLADHFASEPALGSLISGVVDGSVVLAAALAEPGVNDPLSPSVQATRSGDTVRITGEKPAVPALPVADAVVVPVRFDDRPALAVIATDLDGLTIERLETTNHEPQGHLRLEVEVPVDLVTAAPAALDDLYHRMLVANCAIQLGVGEGAIAYVAEHVSTREQFGRTLSNFQAVSQRAADGYILNEALRATVLNAAWQLANRSTESARSDVLAAAYWASDGTQEVVLTAQHLHGGIGADVDYPVHRHFLWGMQMAGTLGTASSHLARLGAHVAATTA
ncbi:MAG: acyl-CoA dehydrogenase family protein [Acidimicrobiia bacterium]|nr:acyl-CoA dehydrogenase family protein [Acidimicrobiia bacterium]